MHKCTFSKQEENRLSRIYAIPMTIVALDNYSRDLMQLLRIQNRFMLSQLGNMLTLKSHLNDDIFAFIPNYAAVV